MTIAQQVEAALASDPELARRYEWARDEFAQETYLTRGRWRAVGARRGNPVRQDRRRAGAKARGVAEPRRPHQRIFLESFAAHAGLVGDGGGARHRAAVRLDRRHDDREEQIRRL